MAGEIDSIPLNEVKQLRNVTCIIFNPEWGKSPNKGGDLALLKVIN